MKSIFFQNFIDIELWNQAKWKATIFLQPADPAQPYGIGIAFENGEAGKEIFRQWRKRLGETDVYEELRLSIIEGDVPGEEPGYTVHITSNPTHTAARAKAAGQVLDVNRTVLISRHNRMNPDPGSPYLAGFKEAYQRQEDYLFLPVSIGSSLNNLTPHIEYAIAKKEFIFRQFTDIRSGDMDSVPFGELFQP